jgi:alkylation response protein AidB-like acyl-CoA dehydrogenase
MPETDDPQIDGLIERLAAYKQRDANVDQVYCLIHGDYRLDNVIFEPKTNRILAVVDWELSTIGHPFADLSSITMPYVCPKLPFPMPSTFAEFGSFRDVGEGQLRRAGIPSELDIVRAYFREISDHCTLVKESVFPVRDWNFWLALRLHTLIGILQGVAKRMVQGNASNPATEGTGKLMKMVLVFLANCAMHALDRVDIFEARKWESVKARGDKKEMYALPGELEPWRDSLSDEYFECRRNIEYFIDAYIIPSEKQQRGFYHESPGNAWKRWPGLERLKETAKQLGLWNLFLPKEYFKRGGFGANLSNLEYASLCELSGMYPSLLPEAMNCAAPDTGNMEVLAKYGSKAQQREWLAPLLTGEIRSAYAMTEPLTASSDARNIECRIQPCDDGEAYIVTGRKWWSSGAMAQNLGFYIVMGRTGKSRMAQSMIIVPAKAKGVQIIRHLEVFGHDDGWHGGHAEVVFDNVKVPKGNLILGEGRGFEISQGRLGPGRIHHCMRLIGMAERAVDHHRRRVLTRFTFGQRTSSHATAREDLARSRMDIEQARLLVLRCASAIDKVGALEARQSISMIKALCPRMTTTVIDRAIQAHGGMGVCQDTPLADMWVAARALRIADGPDAVHEALVGRLELQRAKL